MLKKKVSAPAHRYHFWWVFFHTKRKMRHSDLGIQSEIHALSESTDFSKFLEKSLQRLSKTFELSNKALSKEENKGLKEDRLRLIEITTFELSVNEKKSLK